MRFDVKELVEAARALVNAPGPDETIEDLRDGSFVERTEQIEANLRKQVMLYDRAASQPDTPPTPREGHETLIRGVVQATLELACLRNNLCYEDEPPIVVEQCAEMVEDTWDAMRGIGTCSEEPSKELVAIREALGRAAGQTSGNAHAHDLEERLDTFFAYAWGGKEHWPGSVAEFREEFGDALRAALGQTSTAPERKL